MYNICFLHVALEIPPGEELLLSKELKKYDYPVVIVSVDAENALDRIKTNFFLETMRVMNFVDFLRIITTLFCAPNHKC